jgi:hypothetical protein
MSTRQNTFGKFRDFPNVCPLEATVVIVKRFTNSLFDFRLALEKHNKRSFNPTVIRFQTIENLLFCPRGHFVIVNVHNVLPFEQHKHNISLGGKQELLD